MGSGDIVFYEFRRKHPFVWCGDSVCDTVMFEMGFLPEIG